MKNKYKAAIIGAGNMGAFYSPPNSKKGPMTHAHAYKNDKRIKLSAFVDVNKNKAVKATKVWGGRSYENITEMFKKEKIDIVSICVPDEIHKNILEACLKYKPKAVFCEKPLTTDTKSGERLVKEYSKAEILLAVNYTRRFNKHIIELKKEIKKSKYGQPLNIIGIYTKGILHNGSHLIDLLIYLFGEITKMTTLAGRIDWKKSDPTLDAFLKFKNGPTAHLVAADEHQYSIFDLDLLFEKGRIYLSQFGNIITYYQTKEQEKLHRYKIKNTGLKTTIFTALANLINSLEGKEKLLCSGADALETQKACLKLIEIYKKGNAWKN